jgi:hypothetical protein
MNLGGWNGGENTFFSLEAGGVIVEDDCQAVGEYGNSGQNPHLLCEREIVICLPLQWFDFSEKLLWKKTQWEVRQH